MALMGHSMGAAIASMFAGVFPRLVERLVLIDLIGMTPTKISKTSRATAKALEEQIQIMDKISNNAAPELDHTDAVAKAFMVRLVCALPNPIQDFFADYKEETYTVILTSVALRFFFQKP